MKTNAEYELKYNLPMIEILDYLTNVTVTIADPNVIEVLSIPSYCWSSTSEL